MDRNRWTITNVALMALVVLLCVGCQFSGSTALPPLPGLIVETPSGYKIKADSNLKGSLVFKDGNGKEIEVKLKQDVEGVVNAQAALAQGLEGLAKIESERQKIAWQAIGAVVNQLIDRLATLPVLTPSAPIGPPATGAGLGPAVLTP